MFKEKTLLKIIKFGIFAVLFTPLVVSSKTIYPFIFGRTLLMQAIIFSIFGFWLALIYLYPKYRPRISIIVSAILIYFGFVIISSIAGLDLIKSFWGNEERMNGIFTQLHYLALFIIFTSIFRSWKEWRNILFASVVASVLMSFVAILHRMGMITLANIISDSRIGGTIGNPIFFAAYLMFNMFFAALIFIKERGGFIKYFSVSVIILNFIAFSLADSRGVTTGLVVGILMVALGYVLLSENKKIKYAGIGVIILIFLSIGALWLGRESEWISHIPVVGRFSSNWETIDTRFLTWNTAFEAWKENPILGWGEENFNIAFNKYYNPQMLRYSIAETWFDHAHNTILDRMVMNGILGCLAYLAIFIVAIGVLYKKYKDNELDKNVLIIITGLLAGYFVQNLFAFDEPITLVLFFLVLSFINSITKNDDERTVQIKKPPVFIYVVLLFVIFGAVFNYQLYQASAKSILAGSTGNKSPRERVDIMKIALNEWTPYKEDLGNDLLKGLTIDFNNDDIPQKDIKYCFEEAEKIGLKNIERHPNAAQYFYFLGRLYTEMARSGYPQYYENAEKILLRGIELSPSRQQILYGLGRLYLYEEKYDQAIVTDQKMVDLDPEVAESHWLLGVAMLVAGREDGYVEIVKAWKLGYGARKVSDVELYLEAFRYTGEFDRILDLYEAYVITDDSTTIILTAGFCADVASIYAQKGEKEKAIEAATQAALIDSSFRAEAEMFIKLLQQQ